MSSYNKEGQLSSSAHWRWLPGRLATAFCQSSFCRCRSAGGFSKCARRCLKRRKRKPNLRLACREDKPEDLEKIPPKILPHFTSSSTRLLFCKSFHTGIQNASSECCFVSRTKFAQTERILPFRTILQVNNPRDEEQKLFLPSALPHTPCSHKFFQM